MTLFYAAENIPVHSTVQTASPQEAVNFPRGGSSLASVPVAAL